MQAAPRGEEAMNEYMEGEIKMNALDLFCGAGGASVGLCQSGFNIMGGVDIDDQPAYPFDFYCHDVIGMSFPDDVDFIWASPPCQAFTAYKRRAGHVADRPNLIPQVRELLDDWGGLYCIENVLGAPLRNTFQLCSRGCPSRS